MMMIHQLGTLDFSWDIGDDLILDDLQSTSSPVVSYTTPDFGGIFSPSVVISDGIDSTTVLFSIEVIDNRAPCSGNFKTRRRC